MKVRRILNILVLMASVIFLFVLFPGSTWGEHPWDENLHTGIDTIPDGTVDIPDPDPDPDPENSIGFSSMGTPLLWWEIIINNPTKKTGTGTAGVGFNSSTSTATKDTNKLPTR